MSDVELDKFMDDCYLNCNYFLDNIAIARYCLKKVGDGSTPLTDTQIFYSEIVEKDEKNHVQTTTERVIHFLELFGFEYDDEGGLI